MSRGGMLKAGRSGGETTQQCGREFWRIIANDLRVGPSRIIYAVCGDFGRSYARHSPSGSFPGLIARGDFRTPGFLNRQEIKNSNCRIIKAWKRPVMEKSIGLSCPECGGKTAVQRTENAINSVVRRRKCLSCKANWTTREKLINAAPNPNLEQRAAFSIAAFLKQSGLLANLSSSETTSQDN